MELFPQYFNFNKVGIRGIIVQSFGYVVAYDLHKGVFKKKLVVEYFSYEDTKELKDTFTSWIGKKAHIGDGTTDTLKEIEVEESCIAAGKYIIHFKFESNKKFTASEFLKFNGLERIRFNLPSSKNKDEQAA